MFVVRDINIYIFKLNSLSWKKKFELRKTQTIYFSVVNSWRHFFQSRFLYRRRCSCHCCVETRPTPASPGTVLVALRARRRTDPARARETPSPHHHHHHNPKNVPSGFSKQTDGIILWNISQTPTTFLTNLLLLLLLSSSSSSLEEKEKLGCN
jgi:hypothetical protein